MPKWETSQKKAFWDTNIEKVEISHVLLDKVALLMKRCSERGTRNCCQRISRKVWTTYIENVDQTWILYMTRMKLVLDFLFTDSFFGVLCTQVFYSSAWGKKWLKVICVVKSKVIQPQPKYRNRNFLKFNSLMKRLLRNIHWTQKQIGKWVLLGLIISTITKLNSLFVFFPIYQPWHSIVIWCQRFKSFWWMCCWKCTSVPSGRIVSFLPEGKIKCTHLAPEQIHRGCQLK